MLTHLRVKQPIENSRKRSETLASDEGHLLIARQSKTEPKGQ
jgi:hypothetical protein